MADRLTQIVAFVNVAAGATAVLPHGLNVGGVAKIPDLVLADAGGFVITADSAQVSVTNNGADTASVNVWIEFKHSILRAFGAVQTTALSPDPFVAASGGGNSLAIRSSVLTVATPVADGVFVEVASITIPATTADTRFTAHATVTAVQVDQATIPYCTLVLWQDGDPNAGPQTGLTIAYTTSTPAVIAGDLDAEAALALSASVAGDGNAHTYKLWVRVQGTTGASVEVNQGTNPNTIAASLIAFTG